MRQPKIDNRIDLKQAQWCQFIDFIGSIGEKKFRANQLKKWVFDRGALDFGQMSNLSVQFRQRLAETARMTVLTGKDRFVSSDGSIKFLFGLEDGLGVESVWIPEGKRRTLCVSTQAGCKLSCKFCLTGLGGFRRSLSPAEIIDQLIRVRQLAPEGKVTNLVLMGMGEPLDNIDNVLKALKVITDPDLNILGVRKITLSTAGVIPGIERLAEEFPNVKLAVSINSPNDETRSRLMPINKKYPLDDLFAALRRFPLPKGKRITLEYILMRGVNDSDEDAAALARRASSIPSKINLIPLNPFPGARFEPPGHKRIQRFQSAISKRGIPVFTRQSKGGDIMAACGQLRAENELNELIE